MSSLHVAVWVVGIVALYAVIANRLFVLGAKFRQRAVDLGTGLLNDPNVPERLKHTIEGNILWVDRTAVAWRMALSVTPAFVLWLYCRIRGVSISHDEIPDTGASYYKQWDRFTDAVMIAAICNSPLAASLFGIQIAFASFVVSTHILFGMMLNRRDGIGHGNFKHGTV